MKYIILFIIIGVSPTIFAQEYPEKENDTIIVWTASRKLSWSDFQSPSHEGTKGAQSDIGLSIVSTLRNRNVNYVVFPYFYKQRSSTNTSNDYVLVHEQIHFDIAELFARKMRKRIKELGNEQFNRQRYNREIDRIYESYLKAQEDFDKETGHSLVEKNQKKWELRIAAELKELNPYKSKIFVD